MKNIIIELGKAEIEFWILDDKTINVGISVEDEDGYASENKEISKEILKSYIDKLQLFYDSIDSY